MHATPRTVEVSIVIPAYGRPAYLRELLQSLRAATVPYEVIVIDDGSPEPIAPTLVDEFRDMPLRLIRQPNAGVAGARNTGAALANGEFLMFVDDDDLVPMGSLEWRAAFLRSHADLVGVAGRCEFLRDASIIDIEPVRWLGTLTSWDVLVQNRFYSPGQVLFRRSAFERTGGCRQDCLGSDDWALWIDLARIGPIVCTDRIGLQYRLHGGNFSRNIATMTMGAMNVVDRACEALCARHAAVGDSLATEFVESVYAPKLVAAAEDARRVGEWRRWHTIQLTHARLQQRVLMTRARRKVTVVRELGQWRVPMHELLAMGRNCAACAAMVAAADAAPPGRRPVQVPA